MIWLLRRFGGKERKHENKNTRTKFVVTYSVSLCKSQSVYNCVVNVYCVVNGGLHLFTLLTTLEPLPPPDLCGGPSLSDPQSSATPPEPMDTSDLKALRPAFLIGSHRVDTGTNFCVLAIWQFWHFFVVFIAIV